MYLLVTVKACFDHTSLAQAVYGSAQNLYSLKKSSTDANPLLKVNENTERDNTEARSLPLVKQITL